MISLKILSTTAAMALVLPMAAPTASFAQNPSGTKANFAVGGAGGGAVARGGGGAPAANFGGRGGGFRGNVGGGAPVAQYRGGGGGWHGGYGGGYGGGYRHYGGGYRHYGGGGFIPGAVAGAVVGGALASSYGYYGGPGYYSGYDPGYYDDTYYDDAVVAAAPAPVGDDSASYCMQRYRSYDPASGTYLGYDGQRHPCP